MMDQEKSSDNKKSGLSSSGRAKDTLYRVTFRNQINLTAIADQKANIIISINAILISIILAVYGSGISYNDAYLSEHSLFIVPISVLLLFCLVSAIFSIMAASPRILKPANKDKVSTSPIFFGSFHDKSVDQHVEDMNQLLKSKDEIYKNLSIDMYYQGKVLNLKYKRLGLAYKLFLIGIVGAIASFMVVLAL